MSDHVTVVRGYADLASDGSLKGDDPDVIARELGACGGDSATVVAWCPDWILDEKDIETAGRSHNVVAGRVGYETEKALLVATSAGEAWLPKSVIRVFETADGADLDVPQVALSDWAGDAQ
ncbi:hypothetical protein C2R22_06060 [Salinigranum rubrum]|uniref:Uncharacterized protein n=1 Tax=Salinigranum rubrum TaxID=755307 RepID=A0A2I8VH73_9EURY|nr:hypothetical protein [Salinigranum rubrum]AUV81282.1 hypothetical protein C2R22_06060 [Salinigranum rubrum]